jgi:hypothetical protein
MLELNTKQEAIKLLQQAHVWDKEFYFNHFKGDTFWYTRQSGQLVTAIGFALYFTETENVINNVLLPQDLLTIPDLIYLEFGFSTVNSFEFFDPEMVRLNNQYSFKLHLCP